MCTTLVSKSISQQVCHQRQLNWFACLFVISPVFAVTGRGRTSRPAELWASNSSLWVRHAYGAALIYFHSTTWKTVGSGDSSVFINLPRCACTSSKMGCCGNWRGEETHNQGCEAEEKRVRFLCFVVPLIYGVILIGSHRRSRVLNLFKSSWNSFFFACVVCTTKWLLK